MGNREFKYLEAAKPYLKGRWLADVYPPDILERWPYQNINQYHCIVPWCGQRLTPQEMMPKNGESPHAMHETCFAKLTSGVTDTCFICGDWLEDEKLDAQKSEPTQIFHRLHTGAHHCIEYYSVISCKAFGANMNFLLDERDMNNQKTIKPISIAMSW